MSDQISILLVDDSAHDVEAIIRHLKKGGLGFAYHQAASLKEIESSLELRRWDIILCDHFLIGCDSMEILNWLSKTVDYELPVILVSGMIKTEVAVHLMRNGASDYISKDDLSRLAPAIEREIAEAQNRQERLNLLKDLQESNISLRVALESLARTQDQIVASERFRALGQMASGIAHDFNNSLMIMQGNVELLKSDGCANPEILNRIARQIEDSASVVKRLKTFYSERPEVDTENVALSAVFEDIAELTTPRWRCNSSTENGQISLSIEDSTDVYAWANTSQLREILTNLVFNSYDAMKIEGGEIRCGARRVGEKVHVYVSDTGPGMTREVMDRCFEPLFSTKGSAGTGLGLSIVESMVKNLGGEVLLESVPGKGTTVSLVLQASEAPVCASDSSARIGDSDRKQNFSVLVIDDEPQIAFLLKRQVESLGFQATSSTEPARCLEMLANGDFDTILCDRTMPEMSGDEVAKLVKEVRPDIFFAMVSGHGELMLASGDIPEGVDAVLSKPLSTSELDKLFRSCSKNSRTSMALSG